MMAEFNPIVRFKERPTHLNAIKAMCAHCMGCTETHLERGFRDSIRDCTSKFCPLHRYRPHRHTESQNAVLAELEAYEDGWKHDRS